MKNTNERVSLIVPFYNAASTLERCIDSILAQTYRDFELIAVDDGSLDNSCGVIEKYAAADSRVKLLRVKHAGVSAARNAGIAAADGGYIQFIDADDDVEPDMLDFLIGELRRTGSDIAVCNYTHPSIKNYLGDRTIDLTRRADRLEYYQNTFAVQVPWNKLYRRHVITEPYDEEVSFCEDGLFCLANMKNAKRVVSTSRELYHYYVAPHSVSIEESSCINKIAKAENFWETHQTYWYKQTDLLEKTRNILTAFYSKRDAADMLYVRVFDFLLWELIILGEMGIGSYGLIRETQSVLREREFINSIAAKRKYGIVPLPLSPGEQDERAAEFTVTLLYALGDIKINRPTCRTYHTALAIFAALFMQDTGISENSPDFLARALYDYQYQLTPESVYAKELLEALEKPDFTGEYSLDTAPAAAY